MMFQRAASNGWEGRRDAYRESGPGACCFVSSPSGDGKRCPLTGSACRNMVTTPGASLMFSVVFGASFVRVRFKKTFRLQAEQLKSIKLQCKIAVLTYLVCILSTVYLLNLYWGLVQGLGVLLA